MFGLHAPQAFNKILPLLGLTGKQQNLMAVGLIELNAPYWQQVVSIVGQSSERPVGLVRGCTLFGLDTRERPAHEPFCRNETLWQCMYMRNSRIFAKA